MFTLDNFYTSEQWTNLKAQLMIERLNEHGELICEYCGRAINKKYDCIGHHEIELTEDNVNDYEVSLNSLNIKLVHFKCHNKIHQRYNGFRQYVYLVYGSPCSGKTTWVSNVANDDDLILDLDKIWEAICLRDRNNKSNRLKANVFGIRDCLIDQIRTRTGMWRNAYIIGGYPLRTDRDRLCRILNARPIFIDETKEICLSRAINDQWKKFIEDWFEDFVA